MKRNTIHLIWLLAVISAVVLLFHRWSRRGSSAADDLRAGGEPVSSGKSIRTSSYQDNQFESEKRKKSVRRSEADAAAQAEAMSLRLIPLAAKSVSGARPGAYDEAGIMNLMEEISHFDSAQLRLMIGKIQGSAELDDNARAQACGFLLNVMADKDPAAALEILAKIHALFQGNQEAGVSVITLLEVVAGTDPSAAADWLSEHPGILGEGAQFDAAQSRILEGAAEHDPALAFVLMDEMNVTNRTEAMAGIARAARSNEERLALLVALRKKVGTIDDPVVAEEFSKGMLSAIGRSLARDPSAKTAAFLDSAGLDTGERDLLLESREKAQP